MTAPVAAAAAPAVVTTSASAPSTSSPSPLFAPFAPAPSAAPAPAALPTTSRLKPLKHPLDPAVCSKAARYAVRVFDEMSKRSLLLANSYQQQQQQQQVSDESENNNTNCSTTGTSQQPVPLFDREDVLPRLGELLGKGGFNSVYELRTTPDPGAPAAGGAPVTASSPSPLPPLVDVRTGLPVSASFLASKKLAVKFLSDDAMMVPEEFCNGAADLLMEAKYLTALASHPHPSLIQLHGVCSAGPSGFALPDRAGFFLVIDRLYDTLGRRMDVWRELARRRSGHPRAIQALFLQRLMVAQDVASALRHLHRLNVVFRDLKPDNVGFDYTGAVKIFDFGLAKELDPKQKTDSGMYKMSGGTGSRRYMSPEVALNENYSLSADLYSFAILFWEVLTLRKAFAYLPVEEHRERVIKNDERPELEPSWSPGIKDVLAGCWARNPFQRPSARDAHRSLRSEIQTIYVDEFKGCNTTIAGPVAATGNGNVPSAPPPSFSSSSGAGGSPASSAIAAADDKMQLLQPLR